MTTTWKEVSFTPCALISTGTATSPLFTLNCKPSLAPRSTPRKGTARLGAKFAVALMIGAQMVPAFAVTSSQWLFSSVRSPAALMLTADV